MAHAIAKRGGESVVYQGYILASTGIVAGNHNDAFNLKLHLQSALKLIKNLSIQGSCFDTDDTDSAFDTKETRKVCFNHKLLPNIPEIKGNRQQAKPGSKRMFNQDVYGRTLLCLG